MPLFRPEVQQAQAAQWLGSVRLHRPLSFAVLTTAALGLALALVAFAAWGEVNRKARLSGLLVPSLGSLSLTAQQSGVLRQLPIAEGQTVKAGDVLLVLHTERQSLLNGSTGDTTERAAQHILARQQSLSTERTLRELQTRQREQVLTDRIRTLQAELRQAEEELSLQQRRVQLARTTLARNEQLAAAGFVAPAQVQTRQEELIDADGRLQSLERARLALQHDLQALQGERNALSAQLQTDLSQIERSRSSLEQEMSENAARQSTVVTAPFDGTVTALNLKLGQSVQSGQTLVTLVPVSGGTPGSGPQQLAVQAPLQAQLFAPSRTAGFVRPGQTVYLVSERKPHLLI